MDGLRYLIKLENADANEKCVIYYAGIATDIKSFCRYTCNKRRSLQQQLQVVNRLH